MDVFLLAGEKGIGIVVSQDHDAGDSHLRTIPDSGDLVRVRGDPDTGVLLADGADQRCGGASTRGLHAQIRSVAIRRTDQPIRLTKQRAPDSMNGGVP